MNTVLTRAARHDLTDIYEFVAADNPVAAEQVITRLFDIMEQLAVGELKGPEIRLADGRRVRRWTVPPYRVYYRRSSRRTVIVRVYHQARRSLEQSNEA